VNNELLIGSGYVRRGHRAALYPAITIKAPFTVA